MKTKRRLRSSLIVSTLAASLGLASGVARASGPETQPDTKSDGPAEAAPMRFALVVGSNATLDDGQRPLRFADDDAARMAELLREAGATVELLTTFDTESQARFGAEVRRAKRPRKKELEAAMKRIAGEIAKAQKAGRRTEFTFYYSGHGDVGGDGRSYLTLEDGPLTRHDLFEGVLGRSEADLNHLLLDACQSEEFVLARGEWKDDRVKGEQSESVRDYLQSRKLSHFPNTGVLLASSVDQQTHEWERYRGGIFTHELLSGLRGAADINGDGAIEYSELGAFVSSANRGVEDPRARLEVTVLPPAADQRAPVLAYEDPTAGRVLFFAGRVPSRYEVEDARGVRLADLRRSPGRPAYLRVPDGELFVYRGEGAHNEARIDAAEKGRVEVEALEFKSRERASRGALDEAFREGLFEVPYGLGYYAGFTESAKLLAVQDPEWRVRVWGRDENGELVEVARVEGEAKDGEAAPVEGPEPEDTRETVIVIEEETVVHRVWGSMSVGLELTPYNPNGEILGNPRRVIANEFHGFGDSGAGRPFRGVDLRWWGFDAKSAKDRPRADGYFRTGYTQGGASFIPSSTDARFEPTAATRLDYFTVPLFFAGNIYAFRRFPLRPFAGAGAGFDILSVDYRRADGSQRKDVSARIGFELHAGLDLRINNWFSLVGEVRQLWSARRKIAGLPDYSNEGLTFVTSLRVGFPLAERKVTEKHRVRVEAPAAPPAPKAPPAPEAPPKGQPDVMVTPAPEVPETPESAATPETPEIAPTPETPESAPTPATPEVAEPTPAPKAPKAPKAAKAE